MPPLKQALRPVAHAAGMRHLLPLALASAALAAKASAAPPPAAPKAEIDPQAKRITGSDNYVPTFGLRASIARGFKVHGVMAVDAGLDVPKEATRKQCEALRPRLTSSMRDAILNYVSLTYVVGERPDVDILAGRLQKAVDGVLGKGEAKVALASVIVYDR
jgi:hypothetical protein